MFRILGIMLVALLLSACGRTIAFKDGVVADQRYYNHDYNLCVQQAQPLYPTVWIKQSRWVQVPVYGRRMHDGREKEYLIRYDSRLTFDTVDANENERKAYIARCISAKGYTYRYLSKEELEAAGLE
jgi:hypothetical protein